MGNMYNTPATHRLRIASCDNLGRSKQIRNHFQTPRPTASPWRSTALHNDDSDLCANRTIRGLETPGTIDNITQTFSTRPIDESKLRIVKAKTHPPVQPKRHHGETNIVRQSTILWQDIHPKDDSVTHSVLKATNNRRECRKREYQFTQELKRKPMAKNKDCERAKESMKPPHMHILETSDHSVRRRPCNEIKLTSLSSTTLPPSKRIEPENTNAVNQSPYGCFIDFKIPCARYYGKKILPSL